MPNPFDKSSDPNAPIDLSLFSHIHNDAELSGTFELEGNTFARTTAYLGRYLDGLATHLSDEVLALKHSLSKTIEIEIEIRVLSRKLQDPMILSSRIVTDLMALKENEYLSIPGGWVNPNGNGHAMMYQFKRTSSGFNFYIHNAGAGLKYHERKSATDRELYYPVQAYQIPEPVDDQKLSNFLYELILAQLPYSRAQNADLFDEEQLYEKVLPQIAFLNAQLISISDQAEHAFTSGQLSGTCAQRSLHQMLKGTFRTSSAYQRFIYDFKRYALDDYINVLKVQKNLGDPRVQSLLKSAIKTLLRTLNTGDVFDETFITKERRELDAYREQLTTAIHKPLPNTAPDRVQYMPKTQFTITLPAYSHTLSASCPSLAVSHSIKEIPTEPLVMGGKDLLIQLDIFLQHCKILSLESHHTILIDRIEALFARFPLPSKTEPFGTPIEFYRGINQHNQVKFYTLINSLQDIYLESYNPIRLPAMLVVGLSVMSIIDYITTQFPISTGKPSTFHDITASIIIKYIKKNLDNPYFATNNPMLDSRLKVIQSLYLSDLTTRKYLYKNDVQEYYLDIINSEPLIKEALLKAYVPPKNHDVAVELKQQNLKELYYLTRNFDVLSQDPTYKPLTDKFKLQKLVEQCYQKSRSYYIYSFGGNKIQIFESPHVTVNSIIMDMLTITNNEKHFYYCKYGLPNKPSTNIALLADNNYHQNKFKDNEIQLYEHLGTTIKWSQSIDQRTMVDRELLHLRSSPIHQIDLTLDYFKKHMAKISDLDYQIYIEANLFEPGLLLAALDKDSIILDRIEQFVQEGLRYHTEQGYFSQSALFFIRLNHLVTSYATAYNPLLGYERLISLQRQITDLLELHENQDAAIKYGLHLYHFLTSIACFKFASKPNQHKAQNLLALTLPSYLYLNSQSQHDMLFDSASQFDLSRAKHVFKTYCDLSLITPQQISQTLESLGLGVVTKEPTRQFQIYSVFMKQGDMNIEYRVDIELGLIFNQQGLACIGTPLNIMNHRVMRFLNPQSMTPCFVSKKNAMFEVGKDPLRFIQNRLQKQWRINGQKSWYELRAFNLHQENYGLDHGFYTPLKFPNIIKQRDNQLWINCENNKFFIITERNRPAYAYMNKTLKKLDEQGCITDVSLCLNDDKPEADSFYQFFKQFESASFITIARHHNKQYEITFGRYGLILLATKELNNWVFHLQNDPSYILVDHASLLMPDVVGLIFENKITRQRMCYLPVQPFILTKAVSSRTAFYHLKQDISRIVPDKAQELMMRRDYSDDAKHKQFLPWQYTESERIIRYQLGSDDIVRPDNPADALYLCYVLLGSLQPNKAWDVLEDCAKRLGGLKHTIDELNILDWIINALPKDERAGVHITTPPYVACQLKVLALFTGSFTPDNTISFPKKIVAIETWNDWYQEFRLGEVKDFYAGLNQTLFSLYSRYQTMRRHLGHEFNLKDSECKSLLDYYHFNLPGEKPKAIGALGYEWQRLRLKSLKQESEALHAQEQMNGRLPLGYQKRLIDIDVFLKQEEAVCKHHSELVLLPIDLSLSKKHLFIRVNEKKTNVGQTTLLEGLKPNITEAYMDEYFNDYLAMMLFSGEDTRKKEAQASLVAFCRTYLIANRHTTLDEQNETSFLFNVLWRVANNRDLINKNKWTLTGILNNIESLPHEPIAIYQLKDTTDKILADTSTIWGTLTEEVPTPTPSMIAAQCLKLADFHVERLIELMPVECRLLAQQYREKARIFGQASNVLLDDNATLAIFSKAELTAGRTQVQALTNMKHLAHELLQQPKTRAVLHHHAQTYAAQLANELTMLRTEMIALANAGPVHPLTKQHHDLELEGEVRAPLDEPRLLSLYLRADKAMFALETGLDEAQIEHLHTMISHVVAFSVREQALQRFCKQVQTTSSDNTSDPAIFQQMAHDLLTCDLVDYQTEPVLAVLQYYDKVLLRPQQIQAIKRLATSPEADPYTFCELVEKIIMGGGKSKVILPALARKKTTGSNLVVVEVPRALFETNCTDLSSTSARLFNQKACPFEFNRDSDCSPAALQFIHDKLINIITAKNYLVTTGDSVQSLELKYLELLLQKPDDPKDNTRWTEQIACLNNIVSLFRARADVIIDEVHDGLLLKKKLNYTLGDRHPIPLTSITECIELYKFFEHVSLDSLGDAFEHQTLASLLENKECITKEEQWKTAIGLLACALLEHPKSPFKCIFPHIKTISDTDKQALQDYLLNNGIIIPDLVVQADETRRSIIALYKEQVSELLSQTLKRNLNEHYGPSRLNMGEKTAIPYLANNVPNERSRFGNHLEAINFTIQMFLINGVEPEDLKRYLEQLQIQTREELLRNPMLGMLDKTPTASLLRVIAPDFEQPLHQIQLDNDVQFKQVFYKLRKNKGLIFEILKSDVLTRIHLEPEVLHSDAYNHVDIYRSIQGMTGTPLNSSTYHQRLSYNKQMAAATDGFIVELLKTKKTAIRHVAQASSEDFINGLFANKTAGESIRAIIDICATFKGISNLKVAESIARYVRLHPEQFKKPTPLQYILFFNEQNLLCALGVSENTKPIILGSSDPDAINLALDCSPDARFSYYDQAHTLGVDLKQARHAKALTLINKDTTLEKSLQGFLRMRGFQDDQQLELIVPENQINLFPSIDAVIEHLSANDERQLQHDNFYAAQAKMTNLIRNDLIKRLLALPNDDMLKKHVYTRTCQDYFVEQTSMDYFKLYGGLNIMMPTNIILEKLLNDLFTHWSTIVETLGENASDKMRTDLNQILTTSLPFCQPMQLNTIGLDHGKEVEIQKQVQVLLEQQQEKHAMVETFNLKLHASPYQEYSLLEMTQDSYQISFMTLTEMCRKSTPTAPDFGNLYVSRNYYQTYYEEKQFLSAYLKPVHALLFRKQSNDAIECMIISQQDLKIFSSYLTKNVIPNTWISTTQHTILAGTLPDEIIIDKTYQDLIEKARFFNGDFQLLRHADTSLAWLEDASEEKFAFFEQYLLPYRETSRADLLVLRNILSHRNQALRYIIKHSLADYTLFNWREQISNELTDLDIETCQTLTKALPYVNSHWNDVDFNIQNVLKTYQLSSHTATHLEHYIHTQLMVLKRLVNAPIPSDNEPQELILVNYQLLLSLLFKQTETPLSHEQRIQAANWLISNGAKLDEIEIEGMHALELLIQETTHPILESFQWLLAQGIPNQINPAVWPKVFPETLSELLSLPCFQNDESFLITYVTAYQNDQIKLRNLIDNVTLHQGILNIIINRCTNLSDENYQKIFNIHVDGIPLKRNKSFLLKAIKQNDRALQYADDDLKADKHFIITAIEASTPSLMHAADSLRKDKEFILELTKKHPNIIQYAHPDLQADHDFVFNVVTTHPKTLLYPNEFKIKRDFILTALKQTIEVLLYIDDKTLLNNKYCRAKNNPQLLKKIRDIFSVLHEVEDNPNIQKLDKESFQHMRLSLRKLANKSIQLRMNGHQTASDAGLALIKSICDETNVFVNSNNIDVKDFHEKCHTHVSIAQQSGLKDHRGWKQFLLNLLTIISGVGLIAATINLAQSRGKHFFFNTQTDSSKKIDQLDKIFTNHNNKNPGIK